MRIYQLYATGSATANAAASVQMLRSGRIKSVRFAVSWDSVTDNAILFGEVALNNAGLTQQNDATGVIAGFSANNNLLTSGMTMGAINIQHLLDCPITLGQFVYLNFLVPTGTLTHFTRAWVDVQD